MHTDPLFLESVQISMGAVVVLIAALLLRVVGRRTKRDISDK